MERNTIKRLMQSHSQQTSFEEALVAAVREEKLALLDEVSTAVNRSDQGYSRFVNRVLELKAKVREER
jgi:hypothetical protein